MKNEVDTNKAGAYKVTYRVTDGQGASLTKTITVTVIEKEVPIVPEQPGTGGDQPSIDKPNVDTPDTNKPDSTNKTGEVSSVKTGDSANDILWGVMFVLSGIAIYVWFRKKQLDGNMF